MSISLVHLSLLEFIPERFQYLYREIIRIKGVLENVLKSRRSDKTDELAQYQQRLNEERKAKDSLLEQIRQLNKNNENIKRELVEREEWKASDLAHAQKCQDQAKDEMAKMRVVLEESSTENAHLSKARF